jgi:hypothetical protein
MRTRDLCSRLAALSILAGALAGTAAAGGAPDPGCSAGARPAATLLIPYFEVEVAEPAGLTTLLAVGNADDQPALARVVLWTDWGIPTLAFDVYLAADDLQTINLRDVFSGTLPTTGGPGFAGCTDPVTNPTLGPDEVARLRQQHTGQPDGGSMCSGSGRAGAGVANGYLTVDALNDCRATPRYPSDEDYFETGGTGVASNDNVLYGDFFYADPEEDFAQGSEAVHVVADEARFGAGVPTFYGNFFSGPDARAPLPTRWRARYLNGGGFDGGTDLVVWAEPGFPTPTPSPCGNRAGFIDPCQDFVLRAFDEAGQGGEPFLFGPVTEVARKFVPGGPDVPVDSPFGFVELRNRVIEGCIILPVGESPRQSWVQALHKASGQFSVGHNAIRTGDELCEASLPLAAAAP